MTASILSNYFSWDGFSRRCKVAAEFDSELDRRLANADFERLEDPAFLDMQKKAQKFLYCDWHGFGYLLDCAMNIIGQLFTLIGISAIIATLDWKIIIAFAVCVALGTKIEGNTRKKPWLYHRTLFPISAAGCIMQVCLIISATEKKFA